MSHSPENEKAVGFPTTAIQNKHPHPNAITASAQRQKLLAEARL